MVYRNDEYSQISSNLAFIYRHVDTIETRVCTGENFYVLVSINSKFTNISVVALINDKLVEDSIKQTETEKKSSEVEVEGTCCFRLLSILKRKEFCDQKYIT